MRIGILTFFSPINYGAFLQALTLSSELSKIYPKSKIEIIDYITPMEKQKVAINVLRGIKHHGIINGFHDIQRIIAFRKAGSLFVKSSICNQKSLEDLYRHIDSTYDILIIGSDAVFNWNQNGYPTAFIPAFKFRHCKVVSYAASVHGLRYFEEPTDRISECGEVFSRMRIIGVRDNNTAKFVKHCNYQADPIHCCDPTLCLDTERINLLAGDYVKRILKKYGCDLSKKYIVVMLPDSEIINEVRSQYSENYQIVTLFNPSKYAHYYLYDLNPFEWATVLSNASIVLTSYFHGTLVALKQGTPVLSIDYSNYNDSGYEGKIKDLLQTRMSLPELYFDCKNVTNEEVRRQLFETIDNGLLGVYNERIQSAVISEMEYFDKFCAKLNDVFENMKE